MNESNKKSEQSLDHQGEGFEDLDDFEFIDEHTLVHPLERPILEGERTEDITRTKLAPTLLERLDRIDRLGRISKDDTPFPRSAIEHQIERQQELVAKGVILEQEKLKKILNETPKIADAIDSELDRYPIPEEIVEKINSVDAGGSKLERIALLSQEDFISFILWNSDYVDQVNNERREELIELKEQFARDVERAIKEGDFPITLDQFKERLARVELRFGDSFSTLVRGLGGYHSPGVGLAVISTELGPDTLKRVVYHELLHSLEGETTVRIDTFSPSSQKAGFAGEDRKVHMASEFEINRRGLSRVGSGFEWINEAVTEQLTQLLCTGGGMHLRSENPWEELFEPHVFEGSYQSERILLGHLLVGHKENITLYDLAKSYFEDYLPDEAAGEKRPGHKNLHKRLADVWPYTKNVIAQINQILTKPGDDKIAKYRKAVAFLRTQRGVQPPVDALDHDTQSKKREKEKRLKAELIAKNKKNIQQVKQERGSKE